MLTKTNYVKRLERMLDEKARNVCDCCPGERDFVVCYNSIPPLSETVCLWCKDFIDIKLGERSINGGEIVKDSCPCCIIVDPIERTRKAFAQWHKGTHKWQKK